MKLHRTRRNGLALASLVAVAALVTGCGASSTPEPSSEASPSVDENANGDDGTQSGEPDLVRVGVGPFLSFSPMWVAMELGYFEQAGIDIEIVDFLDGSLAVPALVAGELDVGGFTMSAGLFNSFERGAPFKLVLDGSQEKPGSGVVALNVSQELADAGVTSIDDIAELRGKKIGVTALGSINQYVTARALEHGGLDPQDDVEWVIGIPQPDMIGALGQQRVDAANFAVDISAGAAAAGAGPVLVRGHEAVPDMQAIVYAMHDDFMADRRDVAERFVMAMLKGIETYKLAHDDPDAYPEVLEAIANHTTLGDPEKLRNLHPWWPWVSRDGGLNVNSIMEQQEYWANEFGMVQTIVEEAAMIDMSIVESARERFAAEAEELFD